MSELKWHCKLGTLLFGIYEEVLEDMMVCADTIFSPASDYLIARIPETSFLIASILMIFASDYLFSAFLLRRLKKRSFITRTLIFVLYALLALPAMTVLGAYILRVHVLEPFSDRIILVMLACFLLIGVLLSIRYNMKIRLKVF